MDSKRARLSMPTQVVVQQHSILDREYKRSPSPFSINQVSPAPSSGSSFSHKMAKSRTPKAETPPVNTVPGALAIASTPAAALFDKDDWSWHRNPAAAIRSGGVNKQTPVWKYFVYNKLENLSRCIIEDCTYSLKGPHTSTLACHLKKHPVQYAEFQKLKVDYSKERTSVNDSPLETKAKVSSFIIKTTKISHTPLTTKPAATAVTASGSGGSPLVNALNGSAGKFHNNNKTTMATTTTTSLSGGGKWSREERKQKELETRLALMLSAAQLPLTLINNSFFRELLEAANPRFVVPTDVVHIDQMVANQYARALSSIRATVSQARKVAVCVDVLRLPGEETTSLARLCVSVALYNSVKQTTEVLLLGIRQLVVAASPIASVRETVEQVLSDFGIDRSRVSRYLCNGVYELLQNEQEGDEPVFPSELIPYTQKLSSCLLTVLEANETIEELKKNFYGMMVQFVTLPEAIARLQALTGRAITFPTGESFLVLVETVLEIRTAFVSVCEQYAESIEVIGEGDWLLLEAVSRLLRLFRQHMALTQANGSPATVDDVVPSLMQLVLSLEKDFEVLGELASELKADLLRRAAPILNTSAADFDGTYLLATALNPQLTLLLDDDQLAYARAEIENMLVARIREAETATAARRPQKNNGGGELGEQLAGPSALYPDLIQAANQRRKFLQEKSQQNGLKNRFAEAIVQSFFDDILSTMASSGQSHTSALQFWRQYATKSVHLSEIALELLSIPSSTVSLDRIFAISPEGTFDPMAVLKSLDDPQRMERDTMLRFNKAHLPRL